MEAEGRSELSSLPIRQMLVVGAGVFSISAVANFRSPLLPPMGEELAMSPGQLGLVMTAFAVGRLVTNVPAGMLVDRIGVTWIYAIAGAVLGVGSTMFALAPTAWWVLAGSAIVGMSTAMSMTSGMTYFAGVVGPRHRGTVMSILSASLLGGQALGPAVSGALADAGTWRTAMVLASVVGAVIAVGGTGAALRRRSQPTAAASAQAPSADLLQLGVRLRVGLYAVPFATMFMMGSLPNTLVPIIGASSLGLSSTSIGVALGVAGICRMLGSPISGWLSDRFARKKVLVPLLLLQSSGVVVLAFATTVAQWMTSIAIMALFSAAAATATTMLADLSGSRRMGRRLGSYRLAGDAGLIVGPTATALLYEHIGQVPAVLSVAVLLVAVAANAAFSLPETRWLHTPEG